MHPVMRADERGHHVGAQIITDQHREAKQWDPHVGTPLVTGLTRVDKRGSGSRGDGLGTRFDPVKTFSFLVSVSLLFSIFKFYFQTNF